MKAVLDGLVCNTRNARKMAQHDNGAFINDDDYCRETLYRTDAGKYFLHIFGNCKSPVASLQEGVAIPGERMIGLTYGEAMAWTKRTQTEDFYRQMFLPEEERTLEAFDTFCISEKAQRILGKRAAHEQRSGSAIVADMLEKLA